ncbi:MAG: CSLREA domain-containing protein, partial [Chloroflexota bacterium]|nr:CSLREA domain-containing protein [Chloroflexota bacterium]
MHRHADHHTRIALFALVLAALLATLSVTAVGAANFFVTVTTTADRNTTCVTGDCSLREAIAFANTHPDPADLTTITLPGALVSYALTNGPAIIQSNVTINGAGASVTVINGSVSDRIFLITTGQSATFNNLTLRNGHDTVIGGGAIASFGSLTLNNCVVSSNTSTNNGGGIYSDGGLLALNNSIVTNNSA